MKRAFIPGLLLAFVLALALRCPQLNDRPMHNDESVNAIKLRDLWNHGGYRYDPSEYHGPTLPYFSLLWMKLIGAKKFVDFTETQLRLLTVLFGTGLILLLPLVADGLGRRATIVAAFLTAISPAMVFYSRYYIHEMLLVFFTLLALGAGWRYRRGRKLVWAVLAGAAVGLMQATKETFVLTLAAAAGALILSRLWNRNAPKPLDHEKSSEVVSYTAAFLAWLVVVVILFTSFFTNAEGLADSIRTYLPWAHRVEGASPHIHGWDFYFIRLLWFHSRKGPVWSELFIAILALIGTIRIFGKKNVREGDVSFLRFIAFYAVLLTIIYCVISYKTPWCLLSFWEGAIMLAGFGAVALFDWMNHWVWKIIVSVLILIFGWRLGDQAWRLATDFAADQRNPYVYGQTSPSVLDLVERVKEITAVAPNKNETVIKVMSPDGAYWPLPWYLRQFEHVGYWSEIPRDPFAPIMIVSTQFQTNFESDNKHVMAGISQLRPQVFLELYVETNLWNAHVMANSAK